MSPARRTLADLKTDGSLETVPVDPGVIANLLGQAHRHLATATAGRSNGDTEGAFTLAYDAARKTCAALILAMGLRAKDAPGSHIVTFHAAGAIAHNFGQRQIVTDAGNLRQVHHGSEYRGNVIDDADAHDAIAIGRELLAACEPAIKQILAAST